MSEGGFDGRSSMARRRGSENLFRRFGKRAILILAALGVTAAVTEGFDEAGKPPRGTFETHAGEIYGIDTSTYRITPGLINNILKPEIRTDPSLANGPNRDNRISQSNIVSINGEQWDGRTPIEIANSPVTKNKFPEGPTEAAPWLMVELEVRSFLGDITPTVGYINRSSATEGFVERIEHGEIAEVNIQNNQITGVLDSGETIPPTQIGVASPTPPTK